MSTYSQWLDSCKLSQVIWIYGTEEVLKENALTRVKALLDSAEFNTSCVYADSSNEQRIWELSRQRSISETGNWLLIVRDADKLNNWSNLEDWIRDYRKTLPTTTLIFLSSSDPPIPSIKAPKATLIRCSTLKPESLIKWVMEESGVAESSARVLLDHTAGNMEDSLNICRKIKALFTESTNIDLSLRALKSLADETISDFVDATMSLDKHRAFDSIRYLTSENRYKALGILDTRLGQLTKLQDLLSKNATGKTLATIPGVPYSLVKELLPSVKYYSSRRVASCRRQLAIADSYQQRGIEEGLLEAVVASW